MTRWHEPDVRLDVADGVLQGARVVGYDLVFLRAGGAWRAYADECPHVGCQLSQDGELIEGVLICTCHGAEFDATSGALLQGPAETPLEPYPVRVVEGRLEVEV